MKRNNTKKILSILLTFVLLTNVFSMGATTVTLNENIRGQDEFTLDTARNPLEFMQDPAVEQRVTPDDSREYPFDDLYEPEIDDGSTDRYIVKYKSGQKQDFQSKLSLRIADSEEISVAVGRARTADVQRDSQSVRKDGDKSASLTSEWEVLTLNEKTLPSEFAEAIRSSEALSDIEYIQPDYKLSLDSLSNGKITEKEIDKPVEKEIGTPTDLNAVTVAVIDTGIDIYHDDLADYMDTENMWDFTQNTNEVYSSSNPLESAHGTHIAGIIANMARENNVNVKILPLKVFNNGFAYTSDIMAAIEYAGEKGATIVNCSFGSSQENIALEEVIENANALFVCAVGNNRRDLTETPSYPACYDLPNVISVASVNADGGFSFFSNYGENIDITALGRDVYSTLPENNYGTLTGTSMSAGFVTAVAAIVKSDESLSADELKNRLIDTADILSNLQNKVNNGRRINFTYALYNVDQTDITENYPADDFDVHGYQPTESELYELYSSTSVTQIASGQYHTLVLKSDGTVWAWGYNYSGQLGNGTTIDSSTPVQVIGLSNIIYISAGNSHSMALKSDGTVWTWGLNSSGQIGNGTTTNRTTPIQVTGLNNVKAISAGGSHSIALKSDGTVWAWGLNGSGQLGDGTTTSSTTPVQVQGLNDIAAVSAGGSYSLILKNDGTVGAWGSNSNGQLGDGTTTSRTTPGQVTGLSGITAISAGEYHVMALKSDGTVWAWGLNVYGQLGIAIAIPPFALVPAQVQSLNGITAISAGSYHSMALKNDETVWTWGFNSYGQLGDGTTANSTTPVEVTDLEGVTAISAGGSHSIALKSDETVWVWGSNQYGQFGVSSSFAQNSTVPIMGMLSDILVTGVTLNKNSTTLAILATEILIATIEPFDATNQTVLWSSSDDNVAEVDQNGEVTAVSAGTATITVTTEDGNKTATCVVTVTELLLSVTKNITANADLIITSSLDNINTFRGKAFKITYNPTQVQLIDFAAQTPELNVGVGVVPDTDLEILSHNTSTGELIFEVNKTIPSGKMWSGAVTLLKFKAKITGNTGIALELLTIEPEPLPETAEAFTITGSGNTITWINENETGVVASYKVQQKINGIWTMVSGVLSAETRSYEITETEEGVYQYRVVATLWNNTTKISTNTYTYTVAAAVNPKPETIADFTLAAVAGNPAEFTWEIADEDDTRAIDSFKVQKKIDGIWTKVAGLTAETRSYEIEEPAEGALYRVVATLWNNTTKISANTYKF